MTRKREKENKAGLVAGFVFRSETGIFVQVEISRVANRILLSLNDDTHPLTSGDALELAGALLFTVRKAVKP